MSFLMKKPTTTPGFAIFRNNANATYTFFFKEGTFQALEGNGTTTLTFEGGYRYFIEWDFAASNTSSSAFTPSVSTYRYYGGGGISEILYSRAYSTTSDQKWLGSLVIDATSDITVTTNNSTQSQSSTISIWRFPL